MIRDLLATIGRWLLPPEPPNGVCQFCREPCEPTANICEECLWATSIK